MALLGHTASAHAEAEAAKARYRRLVAQQRAMPVEDQWKMGSAVRDAKARAYVALEQERLGLR